jgi:hypothetical protein
MNPSQHYVQQAQDFTRIAAIAPDDLDRDRYLGLAATAARLAVDAASFEAAIAEKNIAQAGV